jgi:hypothetical protein
MRPQKLKKDDTHAGGVWGGPPFGVQNKNPTSKTHIKQIEQFIVSSGLRKKRKMRKLLF